MCRVPTAVRLAAHAKINVCLRVLGGRDDGFHDIETLVLPVDLHDDVEVSVADAFEVAIEGPYADRIGNENLAADAGGGGGRGAGGGWVLSGPKYG